MRPVLVDKPWDLAREREGPLMLEELSNETGGLVFRVSNRADAKDAAIKAGRAIRGEYVIGYQPPKSDKNGKWHQVRINSNLPHIEIHTRKGYYYR